MQNRNLFAIALIATALGVSSYTLINNKKENQNDKTKEVNKTSNENPIVWHNMTDGFEAAKKEKKLLIIDVYTDWCGWCKRMDKDTYENEEVATIINKNVIAVKFNPEKNDKHIINKDTLTSAQLVKYLNNGARIAGYPTTFVWKDLNKTEAIQTYSGYLDADNMKTILNSNINK